MAGTDFAAPELFAVDTCELRVFPTVVLRNDWGRPVQVFERVEWSAWVGREGAEGLLSCELLPE